MSLVNDREDKVTSECRPSPDLLGYTLNSPSGCGAVRVSSNLPISDRGEDGSVTIGCAAVSEWNVLYMSEVTLRNDVSRKMEQRRMFRGTRRARKTRQFMILSMLRKDAEEYLQEQQL